ncbi:MAG TPA: UvrD-helicase domain-containing protein, partial [Pirellulales bacterium]
MTSAVANPKQFELTAEQQAALNARGHSVALSAGAGCGKTFVLTERFIAHLQPEAGEAETVDKLHELIAITFTDRAAREMRDRIRSKCAQRLEQLPANAPPEQVRYWVRLLRKLDTARISTIHSFCGALLRSHAVEAGIDPRFSVVEQSQTETLLSELVEDVLREKLSRQDEDVIKLCVDFGLDSLHNMIASLLSYGRAIDFDAWLARTPAEITTIWQRFHQQHVVSAVLRMITQSTASRRLISFLESLAEVPTTLETARSLLLTELPGLANSKRPQAVLVEMHEVARLPKGGKKVWASEELSDQFRDLAKSFRDQIDKRTNSLEFDPQAAEIDAKAGKQFLALARVVHDRYAAKKKELAWLDFNDLLTGAHRLLTDPANPRLREELSSQVKLLLVDECQDTDPLQVELITSLCGDLAAGGKLFFVGDFKQSIYRFRGADPSVFLALQQQTPP